MYIINPYYTVFKCNNWFFNIDTKKINYSDSDITISDPIINIPFKSDEAYNEKLIEYMKKLFIQLKVKIQRTTNTTKPIQFAYDFSTKETSPISYSFNKVLNKTDEIIVYLTKVEQKP
jgi:hypothetical protein